MSHPIYAAAVIAVIMIATLLQLRELSASLACCSHRIDSHVEPLVGLEYIERRLHQTHS